MSGISDNAQNLITLVSTAAKLHSQLSHDETLEGLSTVKNDTLRDLLEFIRSDTEWAHNSLFINPNIGLSSLSYGSIFTRTRDKFNNDESIDNLHDLVIQAKATGQAYVALNVGASEQTAATHWSPLVLRYNQTEDRYTAYYFNFNKGYTAISKEVENELQKYASVQKLNLTFVSHDTDLQKDSYNCGFFTDLYLYLFELKVRLQEEDYAMSEKDKAFENMVSPATFHRVSTQLPGTENIHNIIANLLAQQPNLITQIREMSTLNMGEAALQSLRPEEVKQLATELCSMINDLIKNNPHSDKLLLSLSLLSALTGIYVHLNVIVVVGLSGSAILGVQMGHKELSVREMHNAKNNLLANIESTQSAITL